jgi:hypothetical protein
MMEIKDGRILVVVLNPTLTALVSKQPNESLLPLFHPVVLVPVIAKLAPVIPAVRLVVPVKYLNRSFLLTAGTSLDFHLFMCILSSTSG